MVVAGALCGLLLTGCSGSAPSGRASGAHGAKAGVATQRPLDPRVDPLTGTRPRRTRPVVVVKVDNETLARPYQRGLGPAALIYQELMEGGATRLLAVYDDASPAEVGPIRSVRESDLELLRQFGRVAVGFSGQAGHGPAECGARPGRRPTVRHGSHGARHPLGAGGLLGRRLGRSALRRQDCALLSTPGRSSDARCRAEQRRGPVRAGEVQPVRRRARSRHAVHGHAGPWSRGGADRVLGTWRRAGRGPIRYLDAGGRDVFLRPGQTWILLLPAGRPLTYG